MINFLITLLLLALVLGLIIGIHEFGHFIAAKKCKVHIDEFSLGMGPALYQKKPQKSETTYSLRAFPIGGYVSMAEKQEKGSKIAKNKVLENKGFWPQIWVFINGIVFNFLLAMVLFFISGLIWGKPISVPYVAEVVEDTPAYLVGIEKGDTILEVNGVKTKTLDDFLIEASAKKLKDSYVFKVKKADGKIVDYTLSPTVEDEENWVFGIAFNGSVYEKGFLKACSYGFTGIVDTTKTIWRTLVSLFTGEVSAKNLSGPVGIYSIIDTVKSSFSTLIYIIAYLSVNVGIINLIPIPVFDGGRILILIIEKITGHKSGEKLELWLNGIGFGLMMLLMIYVTFNDIIRLVVG